jgi:hypothetical protein
MRVADGYSLGLVPFLERLGGFPGTPVQQRKPAWFEIDATTVDLKRLAPPLRSTPRALAAMAAPHMARYVFTG